MDIFSVTSMLGGLALFLYGMNVMGDGLRNSSASALKSILSKITSNPFSGFLLGLVITAIVQSSMATVVLTVGLITAGVLTVRQSIAIVFGANVGTTVTAQIIRLIDVKSSGINFLSFVQPSFLAPVALIVGIILIMFIKRDNSKNIGSIIIGFGVLFTGLMNMIASTSSLSDSEMFKNIIARFSTVPLLGTLAGMIITVLIQSSSASVGILQTLCVSGTVTFNGAYSYVLGAAIGTGIVTFVICSLGAKAEAKRISFIHLFFNVTGAVVFLILFSLGKSFGLFPELWNRTVNGGDVADFETAFKLCTALILLFFIPLIEKLSHKVIKSDKENVNIIGEKLSENLFISPGTALSQAENVICEMGKLAMDNYYSSINQLFGFDKKLSEEIDETERNTDMAADALDKYLIALSSHIENDAHSRKQSQLLHAVSDFERIGDHAVNLNEIAEALNKTGSYFSQAALDELKIITDAVGKNIGHALGAFMSCDTKAASKTEPLEEVIDDIADIMKNNHFIRMSDGKCSSESGIYFTDVLINLERISDQCSNIAIRVMGIHDNRVIENEHEYIKALHSGADSQYNKYYTKYRGEYLDKINKIKR